MKKPSIKFKATTIVVKNHIHDKDKAIASFTSDIYSMLDYLENLGFNFSLSRLYSLNKPVEYFLANENLVSIKCDEKYTKLLDTVKSDKLTIHIKIERLTPVCPYFNKK